MYVFASISVPCILTSLAYSYAFDVHPSSQTFMNRRVFAYTDTGIPDGIQLDTNGNVYSGCGDGVQVMLMLTSTMD